MINFLMLPIHLSNHSTEKYSSSNQRPFSGIQAVHNVTKPGHFCQLVSPHEVTNKGNVITSQQVNYYSRILTGTDLLVVWWHISNRKSFSSNRSCYAFNRIVTKQWTPEKVTSASWLYTSNLWTGITLPLRYNCKSTGLVLISLRRYSN